jgi:hypothetical protein
LITEVKDRKSSPEPLNCWKKVVKNHEKLTEINKAIHGNFSGEWERGNIIE